MDRVTRAKAIQIAIKYLEGVRAPDGDTWLIMESEVTEADGGFFVPWAPKRFIETGDIRNSVVGNWPIFVSDTGECAGPRRPPLPEDLQEQVYAETQQQRYKRRLSARSRRGDRSEASSK